MTGESAGAYLASMILLPPAESFCSDRPEGTGQLPAIKAAVLYYGVYDLLKSHDYDFPGISYMYRLAAGTTPEKDPQRFIDNSPLSFVRPGLGLPPTLLMVGAADPLYRETADLNQRLLELGEPVEMKIYPGAGHGFAAGPENFELTASFFADMLDAPGQLE